MDVPTAQALRLGGGLRVGPNGRSDSARSVADDSVSVLVDRHLSHTAVILVCVEEIAFFTSLANFLSHTVLFIEFPPEIFSCAALGRKAH